MSIADLLQAPNPWADWLDIDWETIGKLSTWRLTAVLLRDVPVEQVINLLGPALMAADAEGQQWVDDYVRRFPLPADEVFGFEHWLKVWDKEGSITYGPATCEALRKLDGSADIRLFAEVVADFDVNETALLWFVLGAIQHWKHEGGDLRSIDPGARWLVNIYSSENEDRWEDPLEVLFVFLYERFRAGGARNTQPLPERMAVIPEPGELCNDESAPRASTEAGVLSWVTHHADSYEGDPALDWVLLFDRRSWPKVASDISALRGRGLMDGTGFAPTAAGIAACRMEAESERARSAPWGSTMPQDAG